MSGDPDPPMQVIVAASIRSLRSRWKAEGATLVGFWILSDADPWPKEKTGGE